jgi:hypothetical protein
MPGFGDHTDLPSVRFDPVIPLRKILSRLEQFLNPVIHAPSSQAILTFILPQADFVYGIIWPPN